MGGPGHLRHVVERRPSQRSRATALEFGSKVQLSDDEFANASPTNDEAGRAS